VAGSTSRAESQRRCLSKVDTAKNRAASGSKTLSSGCTCRGQGPKRSPGETTNLGLNGFLPFLEEADEGITNFNVRQFKKERLPSRINPRSLVKKDAELRVRAPASVDRELQLLSRIFTLANRAR
jgi:hypothetical protein